jgi:hypothetical protein
MATGKERRDVGGDHEQKGARNDGALRRGGVGIYGEAALGLAAERGEVSEDAP